MNTLQIEEQNTIGRPSHKVNNVLLYVLLGITVIYTTVVLLLVVNTRKHLTDNEASQQALTHQLVVRQLETETQLNASTEALARRLGLDEHDFQYQIESKSGNFHRQQRELAKLMQAQADDQQQQLGQVTSEVATMHTELGGAKTDIAATRTELASTNAKLEHAVGDLNGQSHLIARTRLELEELRHRGDRNYYEFALTKGAAPTPVSTVSLQLKKVDPKKNKFTLNVVADDRTIEKKDRGVAEPLQFYSGRDRQLYEVVIFTTEKNRVTGYLSTPKTAPVVMAGERP
ncbi:MAG TPA: hypothetical protein VMU05_03560 [Dongiaceae bacterium]|nr:hypothetical protein [Dongiaceae bacterium]